MATHPLNFCRREGREANSLRSNSLPSFSSLQQKVSKERRARDGDFPLDFCRGEGKEPNSLRSDKAPSFFLPATKIQGAI